MSEKLGIDGPGLHAIVPGKAPDMSLDLPEKVLLFLLRCLRLAVELGLALVGGC